MVTRIVGDCGLPNSFCQELTVFLRNPEIFAGTAIRRIVATNSKKSAKIVKPSSSVLFEVREMSRFLVSKDWEGNVVNYSV